MDEVVRPWRGVSAEERRSARRARLLEACLDEVGEGGVESVTADTVVARAGLSKRYFYEAFADREQILLAALDGLLDVIRERVAEALDAEEVAERVRRTVETLARTLAEDPRQARLFEEASRSAVLERRRHQEFRVFSELLATGVYADRGAETADVTAWFVVAGTVEVLARWLAGAVALDESRVVDVITDIGVRLSGGTAL
ncbi:TetR/AcrR family transcriptional regulator [Tsukamurella sp. NPDC003166]|uniref:TetR/AcrR family transcriptional regulator n=1 Tax=Tsukamurella sp. NPDC003166 TaxID=3154444 RepID=UPI0033A80A96